MRYTFEWDPGKANANLRKHKVSFDQAAEVLGDPLAASIRDEKHSGLEERWVTMGKDAKGKFLLLVHTFVEVSAEEVVVRIISARKCTKLEVRQYEEQQG